MTGATATARELLGVFPAAPESPGRTAKGYNARVGFDHLGSQESSVTLQSKDDQGPPTRTTTTTYPSPDPDPLDIHISLLCPFACRIHLIDDLVPSQIVPDDVSEFPAMKACSATVDGEHDDLFFAREVMMPVASETNIGGLRVGSAVPRGEMLGRPWRIASTASYGFSNTGYFFLPEVSRLGGMVSITLSTVSDQCQLQVIRHQ